MLLGLSIGGECQLNTQVSTLYPSPKHIIWFNQLNKQEWVTPLGSTELLEQTNGSVLPRHGSNSVCFWWGGGAQVGAISLQIYVYSGRFGASLVAQMVKNLPAMWETWVWSLGWEDSPGEGKWLPTPVFLPGEFRGQRSLAGQSMGLQRVGHDWVTNTFWGISEESLWCNWEGGPGWKHSGRETLGWGHLSLVRR